MKENRKLYIENRVISLGQEDPTAALSGIIQFLSSLEPEKRQSLLLYQDKLKQLLRI